MSATAVRVPADADLFELLDPSSSLGGVELLASYSRAADKHFWPKRRRCPLTAQPVETVSLEARGTLWTWSYVHLPWRGTTSPSGTDGYGVGLIDLPEGPRVLGVLIGRDRDWKIGDAMHGVALDYSERDGETQCLLAFRRDEQA
ncbi:MAG: Zn-ribbon domain-containing OB-fold protein [Solirubrobacteraceae bacterium]